ncbi:MAG TPA: hypothetical protein VK432_00850 [Stellaceae bacterium]|nr:hypothetical protein [Stellaceae bacterium]
MFAIGTAADGIDGGSDRLRNKSDFGETHGSLLHQIADHYPRPHGLNWPKPDKLSWLSPVSASGRHPPLENKA